MRQVRTNPNKMNDTQEKHRSAANHSGCCAIAVSTLAFLCTLSRDLGSQGYVNKEQSRLNRYGAGISWDTGSSAEAPAISCLRRPITNAHVCGTTINSTSFLVVASARRRVSLPLPRSCIGIRSKRLQYDEG